jgi:two-component system, OmpR family, response regulator
MNCVTYRKLLTIQPLVSRFIQIWRFAARPTAAIELEGLMPRLIVDDPVERLYVFAGWTLEETARDLVNPTGRRVDLTSSEFDLLLAFVRQPGKALSRDALLGTLRGRAWTYFDRSIDTLVARLRKKLAAGPDRPPPVRSVRGVGYIFCAPVARICREGQSAAA